MTNAPERYLSWRGDDESFEQNRLTYTPDSKKTNTGTFVLAKEDHTIGNLLRIQLLRDPSVRFAAYRIPHPLVFDCHLRIETMDSQLTPINALEAALADLELETDILKKQFEEAVAEFERNQGYL